MNSSIKSVLLLCVILVICSKAKAQVGGYRLAEFWVPGYCKLEIPESCIPSVLLPAFTIHGLWPYDMMGNSMRNCVTKTKYKPITGSHNRDLENDLSRYWPNLNRYMTNEKFWANEWKVHGTCAQVQQSTFYFQTALRLHKQNDLVKILGAAGITPNNQEYEVGHILAAFMQGIHLIPQIVCKANQKGHSFLREIYMCTDPLAKSFVNCTSGSNSCGISTTFSSLSSALVKGESVANSKLMVLHMVVPLAAWCIFLGFF